MALTALPAATLVEIIRTQSEIAKLGVDLGGVMALVAERARALTGAEGAVVELAEGEDMVYRAADGTAKRELGLRLRRLSSLSGLCVAERRILTCADSEMDARVDQEAYRKVGLRSMVVAPLIHADTVVGVLKVISVRRNAFSPSCEQILSLMGDLISAADVPRGPP